MTYMMMVAGVSIVDIGIAKTVHIPSHGEAIHFQSFRLKASDKVSKQ
jgi:hypothetical protein